MKVYLNNSQGVILIYKIPLFIMFYLLSSCATNNQNILSERKDESFHPNHMEWNARGRFIISHKEKARNAKFLWKQNNEEFELRIITPVGLRSIFVQGNSQGINSIRGINSNEEITSFEEILELIPLSHMRFWVTGNPNPEVRYIHFSENSDRISFSQLGWTIEVHENFEIESVRFPKKIRIINSESSITILIDDWGV